MGPVLVWLVMPETAISSPLHQGIANLGGQGHVVTGLPPWPEAGPPSPSLVILAADWAGGDSYRFCAGLPTETLSVLFWGEPGTTLCLERMLTVGGRDYLHPRLPAPLLQQRLAQYWPAPLGYPTPAQRLQAVVEQTAVGINEADITTGKFVLANQAFCDLLGYTQAELCQLTFRQVTHTEDVLRNQADIQRLYRGEVTSIQLEKRYLPKVGEPIWTQVTLSLVRDQRGVPIADLAIVVDIRDRKQAEADRDARQRFLQQVLDAVPSAVFVKDDQGHFQVANRATGDIYQMPPDALLGQADPVLNADPPQSSLHQRLQRQVMTTGQAVTLAEEAIVNRCGETRWYQTTLVPLQVAGRVEGIIGNCVDITARRATELALRRSLDREAASARIVRQIQSSSGMEAIFHTTVTELRRVLPCDRVVIYQYAVGDTAEPGTWVAEAVGAGWRSILAAAMDPPQARVEGCDRSLVRPVALLGSPVSLGTAPGADPPPQATFTCVENVAIAPLTTDQRQQLGDWQAQAYITVPIVCDQHRWGWLGVYHNRGPRPWSSNDIGIVVQTAIHLGIAIQKMSLILQLRERTLALEQAKAAADAANQTKGYFLANITHELRTPLNIMLGMTQVLQREDTLSAPLRESLQTILHSGQHLLTLINDVLDLSRLEAGRMPLHLEPVDLAELIQSLEAMLRQPAVDQGLTLRLTLSPTCPRHIRTDASKLRQILLNLLNNAVKFTDQGQVHLQVQGEPLPNGDPPPPGETPATLAGAALWCLRFTVTDTGRGIAPHKQDCIFDAFEQGHSCPGQGGTGLGLAICKHYAQLLGGTLSLDSAVGRGSQFCLALPVTVLGELESGRGGVTHEAIAAPTLAINLGHLAEMSGAWLQQVHTHALRCDDTTLLGLMAQMPATAASTRQQLETYLRNFDFLTLGRLVAPLLPPVDPNPPRSEEGATSIDPEPDPPEP